MSAFLKDPEAVLDYVVDWTAYLAVAETVASAVVTVPAGITLNPTPRATVVASPTVTFWLSGGTEGTDYPIVCRVTTSSGRVDDHTLRILVRSK